MPLSSRDLLPIQLKERVAMATWKKICLGLAFLVALGAAAGTASTGARHPAESAPAIHSPHMGSDFPPPTGG
jgi:hypothetical protein